MTKKKNKPAAQKPYSPTPEEHAAIERAFEERTIAPAPRLIVKKNNAISIDHADDRVGALLIKNALGTSDHEFMTGLLTQLARATSGGANVDEGDLNFMLSFIKGIEPRDQIESTLAAQMATIHMAMMRLTQNLALTDSLPQQDSAERAINRFARTFMAQVEGFKRYRSGGEQKVTVQHVSVNQGGQAIVGNVNQNRREASLDKVPSPPPLPTQR
jgi:hypothetical protein